jgi:hypothetical protein
MTNQTLITRVKCSLFVFALVLPFSSAARSEEPAQLPNKQDLKIFLLIGQSNMAGRGKPLEEQDKTPHPRVWLFNKAQTWVPAVDPLHFDKPPVVGVGLGLTFAKTLADSEAMSIGLVPAAFGGSPISDWAKGGKHYENAIVRAKAALQHGTLAGILWHQGEADSSPEKAALYQAKLDQLVQDLRTDLDSPHIPLIVGTLSDNAKGAGAAQVNAALQTLSERVPHTGCALAEGLTMSPDKIHFDAASYREFGKRYAAQWLRVAKKSAEK